MEKEMNLKRAYLVLLAAMFLPGLALAQDAEIIARFDTNLVFMDANPVETSIVHRECNTGLPLNQLAELGHLGFVEFISTLLPAEEEIFSCSITATAVPNYTAHYSELGEVFTEVPCNYTGLELDASDWSVECHIRMVPDPAEVTVSKDWVVTGAVGDDPLEHAVVVAKSPDPDVIVGSAPCVVGPGYCLNLEFHGADPSDEMFYVKTGYLGETVTLHEIVADSSVETENDCYGTVTVYPGGSASCGFTNTVFFEGIPTLSQYGMAIMALLMLGVGFIGFRRFV
jgi:hypothetical protein